MKMIECDENFLTYRYYELKAKSEQENNHIIKALYRDEMRKIKKILLKKYKKTLDK